MSIQPINIYPNRPLGIPQGTPSFFGSGHPGVDMVDRIVMGLRSGIADEVEWSINCLYQQSFIAPGPINLEKNEFLGTKAIEYFTAPFKMLKNGGEIDAQSMILSVNSALAIRNLIQDLTNQQWLSQVHGLKNELVGILKFLVDWFYYDGKTYKLSQFNDQFMECLYHLVDILDTLTCYYINNPKDDELFRLLLDLSTKTSDKFLILGTLRCLTHLLFTRAETKTEDTDSSDKLVPIYDNCIDMFTASDLEHYLNYLLVNDQKLNLTVLEFMKQYATSGASIKNQTVDQSRSTRLKKLLQLDGSKGNLHTIFKSLPSLIVQNLNLNEVENLDSQVTEQLLKRTKYSSVPLQPPPLPTDVYGIISRFKEPARSTIWLRCCYEPIFNDSYVNNEISTIGEVTQISLWKAYEKQFESIWKNKSGEFAELLQAVDFIKNVNNAFPNSEAMVIVSEDGEGKKKFIIRGIQPRQFAVSIDEGNYDALKKRQTIGNFDQSNASLPIGTVDISKFQADLGAGNRKITDGVDLTLNRINLASKDILDVVIDEVKRTPDLLKVFKLYNSHWLLDTVYGNPILLETGIIDPEWLKYLM